MADNTDVLAHSAPWVDIELDKPRKLRFRHNDLADMESSTGRSFDQLMDMRFHGARIVLQHGLRWMDRTMTAEAAGNLIQDHWLGKGRSLNDLADVITEALMAGGILPRPKETTEGNAQPDAPA